MGQLSDTGVPCACASSSLALSSGVSLMETAYLVPVPSSCRTLLLILAPQKRPTQSLYAGIEETSCTSYFIGRLMS